MEIGGKVGRPRHVRSARGLSGLGLAAISLWLLAAGADAQKIPEVRCRVEDYPIDTLGGCRTDAAAVGQVAPLRGDVYMMGGTA
jgi:hypothetical protein